MLKTQSLMVRCDFLLNEMNCALTAMEIIKDPAHPYFIKYKGLHDKYEAEFKRHMDELKSGRPIKAKNEHVGGLTIPIAVDFCSFFAMNMIGHSSDADKYHAEFVKCYDWFMKKCDEG